MFSPIPEPLNIESHIEPYIELRVLHGPQAGAALLLNDEEIVIGSDSQCDVILQSPGIAPRHARLSLGDGEFTVCALEGAVVASVGAAVAPPWPLGAVVYLGDVGITIDRAEAEWTPAPPVQATIGNGPRNEAVGRWPAAWANTLQRRWKHVALLIAILAAFSIAAQWIQSTPLKTGKAAKLSPANIEAIKLVTARYKQGTLKLDVSANKAVLRGFLPNINQVGALKQNLSAWRPRLDIDVHAEDALLAASRRFLAREHSALKVAIVNGSARLSGFGEGKKDIKNLAQELKKEVAGLAGVDAMFVEQERLEGWLRDWRKETATGSRDQDQETLYVESGPAGDLALHGELDFPLIARLRDTLTHRSLQKNLLLALHIAIAPDLSSRQPPSVQAFSAGPVPTVFLSNGKRVMIGGAVNGFQLIAINEKGPVFIKQGG
jgi:type III secretion system YscD/HrpQ family protein